MKSLNDTLLYKINHAQEDGIRHCLCAQKQRAGGHSG